MDGNKSVTAVFLNSTPDDSIVANWRFDEGSGNKTNDSSRNKNHGIILGCNWSTGINNSALEFNGINNSVLVSHNESQNVSDQGTWIFWLKLYDYERLSFISKRDNWDRNNSWNMGVDMAQGLLENISFEYAYDGTNNTKTHIVWNRNSIPLNIWIHITFVYNSSDTIRNVRMYVNGTEINPIFVDNRNKPLFSGSSDIFIGAVNSGTDGFLNGCIDEVSIYNRALSSEEIFDDYYKYL